MNMPYEIPGLIEVGPGAVTPNGLRVDVPTVGVRCETQVLFRRLKFDEPKICSRSPVKSQRLEA